jgi:hypothetical protein
MKSGTQLATSRFIPYEKLPKLLLFLFPSTIFKYEVYSGPWIRYAHLQFILCFWKQICPEIFPDQYLL